MTDSDHLRAAATRLESLPHAAMTYGWFDADGQPMLLWGPTQAHALADLLDAIESTVDPLLSQNEDLFSAALAVADQVSTRQPQQETR